MGQELELRQEPKCLRPKRDGNKVAPCAQNAASDLQKRCLVCVVCKPAFGSQITCRGLALIGRAQHQKSFCSQGNACRRKGNQAQTASRHVKQSVKKRTSESRRTLHKAFGNESDRFAPIDINCQKILLAKFGQTKSVVREHASLGPRGTRVNIVLANDPPNETRLSLRRPRITFE